MSADQFEGVTSIVSMVASAVILFAGVYAAFAARRATQFKLWLVGFLIVIAGVVVQVLLVAIGSNMLNGDQPTRPVTSMLSLYSIAWICYYAAVALTIVGRVLGSRTRRGLVTILAGSVCFILAMIGLAASSDIWDNGTLNIVVFGVCTLVVVGGTVAGSLISLRKYRRAHRQP